MASRLGQKIGYSREKGGRLGDDPSSDQVWQQRRNLLPKLQARANILLNLIIEGLPVSANKEAVLPADLSAWFTEIYSEAEENEYSEKVELLQSTSSHNRANNEITRGNTLHIITSKSTISNEISDH